MNNVVLIGRLTRDPELRFIPASGMAVAKFNLAVDRGLYGKKKQEAIEQGKPAADFIPVTVFGKTAENAANYLAKGRQCAVLGRISTGNYTDKDGNKVYTTEVIADRLEFIGKKKDGASAPGKDSLPDSSFFDDFPDDDDGFFQPVSDEEIPF